MNTRFAVSMILVSAMAVSMTGCKGLFGKKKGANDGVSDVTLTDPSLLDGQNGNRIGSGSGQIIDAQLSAVQFAFDSALVDETERAKAEAAASYLKANAGTFVTLEGNCDEQGSAEYNMSLGERRAQAVRTYLMNLGIDSTRIQTKSFGKEKPKDPGHDEKAWSVNRRVEFVVMK
ncbi:MAG: OmpA family protein [bacterium]|jgi:peptidoglycan-associated lipoprotein